MNIMTERPKLFMLIGLPGSGKTEKAKQLIKDYDCKNHSSDNYRVDMFGDVDVQSKNGELFTNLQRNVRDDLSKGYNVVYDATNISYKKRKAFLQSLNKIDCEKIAIVIATPYEVCLEQNKLRDRKVPDRVIERMYRNFDIPYYYEGWDKIIIHYNQDEYRGLYGYAVNYIVSINDYDQCNEHHTFTLGEHCTACRDIVAKHLDESKNKLALLFAAHFHDCGKPFCQTFINGKGQVDKNAHYYNHEKVGSYNFLFYKNSVLSEAEVLYASMLIRWHMQMYFIEKEPHTEKKYRNLLGNDIYNDLTILHKGDKEAH